MRWRFIPALWLIAAGAAAQDVPLTRSSAPIAIFTGFEHPCPAAVMDALEQELENAMAPAGIYFEWRSLDVPADRARTAAELAVVTFKGTCAMAEGVRAKGDGGPLGWTHITDGELLSFIDVDCNRIRGVIDRLVRHWPRARRERALGRAVGRVMAHELYHLFANTRSHASRGLLKHYFGPKDLVELDLQFEPAELAALRENKLRWLFQPPPRQPASGH